jgi:hypothetical protein
MQKAIMKTYEYDDGVYFRIMCDCGDAGHDISIAFEEDRDGYKISMNLETAVVCSDLSTLNSPYWTSKYDQIMWRLRNAFKIIFTGRIEAYASFLLSTDNLAAFKEAIRISEDKFKKELI